MLANDVARCHGLRSGYTDTVRPLDMCQTCARWQNAGTGGPRTPYIQPHAVCELLEEGGMVLTCSRRIEAKPLPIEG